MNRKGYHVINADRAFSRISFLLLCCGLFICTSTSCQRQELHRQLELFTRQEVVIPEGIRQMVGGRDTVLLDPAAARARLVVYVDSADCSSCRVGRMYEYDGMIGYRDEAGEDFMPVFIFSPSRDKLDDLMLMLKYSRFEYPVLVDEGHVFESCNGHIPADRRFHTFLLDSSGKVVLVGDPVHNPKLWELYKTTISQLIENGGTMPTTAL